MVRSGAYLLGPELDAFEGELAAACGRRHAVGVASGTDALRLSLLGLGVGPGDEVVVPAFTAVPTAAAVCATGAVPVFADVDPDTATLDPAAAAARGHRSHTRGDPGAPVRSTRGAARPRRARRRGRGTGARRARSASGSATVACSFYPTKNLGGICDGGAVLTDDDDLAATIRLLRVHGHTGDYVHTHVSTNARLSELAAAALRVELPSLGADNAAPRRRSPPATARPRRGCAGRRPIRGTCTTSAWRGCPTATRSARACRSPPACTTRGRSRNNLHTRPSP